MSNLQERFEAWVLMNYPNHIKEYGKEDALRKHSFGDYEWIKIHELWRAYQACAADLMPLIREMRDMLSRAENIARIHNWPENRTSFMGCIVEADKILEGK